MISTTASHTTSTPVAWPAQVGLHRSGVPSVVTFSLPGEGNIVLLLSLGGSPARHWKTLRPEVHPDWEHDPAAARAELLIRITQHARAATERFEAQAQVLRSGSTLRLTQWPPDAVDAALLWSAEQQGLPCAAVWHGRAGQQVRLSHLPEQSVPDQRVGWLLELVAPGIDLDALAIQSTDDTGFPTGPRIERLLERRPELLRLTAPRARSAWTGTLEEAILELTSGHRILLTELRDRTSRLVAALEETRPS